MEHQELDATNQTILARLAASPSPVSGEVLAQELGLSRVALWKRMEALRGRGCTIVSSRQGYRLVAEDLLLAPPRPEADTSPAEASGFPAQVRWHDCLDSTMDSARDWALAGAPHGSVVLAERQRSGRGQQGRVWLSPEGGLYASIIIRAALPLTRCGTLVLEAGALLCRHLRQLSGLELAFRWPNDLLIQDRKLGGLLVEAWGSPDRPAFFILGMGINTGTPESAGTPATGLRDLLPSPPQRRELAGLVASHLHAWAQDPDFNTAAWEACASLTGQAIHWTDWQGQEHDDTCLGYNQSAGLVCRNGTIPYGESRFLRPVPDKRLP